MSNFPLSRLVAAVLAWALVVTAPGLGSYAAAQVVVRSGPGTAVVPTAPAGAARGAAAVPLSPSLGTAALPGAASLLAPAALTPRAASLTPAAAQAAPVAAAASPVAAPIAAPTRLSPAAQTVSVADRALSRGSAASEVLVAAAQAAAKVAPNATAPLAAASKLAGAPSASSFSGFRLVFDGGVVSGAQSGSVLAGQLPGRVVSGLNAVAPELPDAEANSAVPAPNSEVKSVERAAAPYEVVALLAAVGGAAAYFLIPVLLPMLPTLPVWLAANPLLLKGGLIAAGVGVGAALSEYRLLLDWPSQLAQGALSTGKTAFRFWARFGRVFASVLTASSMDEAMKAELPAGFWRYPVLAWPAVLVGYAFAPVLFVLGGVYKAVEVPVLAAFRGLRRVVVELLPWLGDLLDLAIRFIRNFFPALWRLITRGVAMAFYTAAGGAVVLAAPVWNGAVYARYAVDGTGNPMKLSQVPAVAGMLVGRLLGLVAAGVLGVVGAAVGLVAGLPLTVTDALLGMLARVSPGGRLDRADKRWTAALKAAADMAAFTLVMPGPASGDAASLPRVLARVGAAVPGALYALPHGVFSALVLWVAGLAAALGYAREAAKAEPWAAEPRSSREDKPAEEITGSPWAPMALGLGGLAAGWYLAPLSLPLLATAAIALIGGLAGLSLSQPGVWLAAPAALASGARAGGDVFRLGARLGLAADSTLRGRRVDQALFKAAPVSLTQYPVLAWPGLLLGAVLAPLGAVVGAAAAALGVPAAAAWRAAVVVLTAGVIRRILTGLKNVAVHGLPFTLGLVLGTLWGAIKGAALSAWTLAVTVWRAVIALADENPYRYTGLTGLATKRLVQALGGVVGLAAGVVGAAVGLVSFAPSALTEGLALGLEWAGAKGGVPAWLRRWRQNFQRDLNDGAGLRLLTLAYPYAQNESGLWQGVLRTVNTGLYALLSPLWFPVAATAMYVRAAYRASTSLQPAAKEWKKIRLDSAPRYRPDSWLMAINMEAMDAFYGTAGFWSAAGAALSWAVLRRDDTMLGWPHEALAWAAGIAAGASGALAGAFEYPARGVLAFIKKWALKLVPYLESLLNVLKRIALRIFPFMGGLIGGAALGVVGSAAFGAVLLARPWFKYVVAENYETSSLGRFLGTAALRAVAALAGVGFGALGLAFGLLAALPYSVTFMVATAFDWGGIGGTSERFFLHWKRGSLPAEMKRLSKLTDSFEFSEKRVNGELDPMAGWIRLGMVFAATFAAALAATIAGLVAYGRSILAAATATRTGAEPPAWSGPSASVISGSVRDGAKYGGGIGGWVGGLAGIVLVAMIAFSAVPSFLLAAAPLGVIGPLLLGAPLGWLAGVVVGTALGALTGMLLWLDRLVRAS
ncbi:MAG: hypothetical protein HYZ75_09625 [Elusimicrobia bacterium]|nr:hypothetical protein [Elusimicrobiota bacterium]